MGTFTDNDKKIINDAYKMILFNLKNYLQQYNATSELEYSKIVFHMLHSGLFSVNEKVQFDDDYDYLGLPSEISQGVHIMYGICCCWHATEFLYDLLCFLGFDPSLIYIWVDSNNGIWHRVNPAIERVNHQAILINKENRCIIDVANKFIFQIQKGGKLKLLNPEYHGNLGDYQEDNIAIIGKILKKYYTYKELGIRNVYY